MKICLEITYLYQANSDERMNKNDVKQSLCIYIPESSRQTRETLNCAVVTHVTVLFHRIRKVELSISEPTPSFIDSPVVNLLR